jgi:hypothetical protein
LIWVSKGEGRTHIWVCNLTGFSRAHLSKKKWGELVAMGLTTVANKVKGLEMADTKILILLVTN